MILEDSWLGRNKQDYKYNHGYSKPINHEAPNDKDNVLKLSSKLYYKCTSTHDQDWLWLNKVMSKWKLIKGYIKWLKLSDTSAKYGTTL